MFPLGESTLALDEEMLQVLDAVDPVKPAFPTAVNRDAQESPASSADSVPLRSLAPVADNKRESDRAHQPAGHHRAPSTQESVCRRSGDCKRPGRRADCKDLAQRLLFSEDLEEAEHAQRGARNIQSLHASACIDGLSSQEIKKRQQLGGTTE